MKQNPSKSKVQGEGDYASAKKYNEHATAFAHSGKVEQAAKNAAPHNAKEEADMRKAEAEGRSHAKGQPNMEKDGNLPPGSKPEKRAPGKSTLSKSASGR